MPKTRKTISFLIPPYGAPRNTWRKSIHRRAVLQARETGVRLKDFKRELAVSVTVKLYLPRGAAYEMHDVDNRLKDILDALQGRAGGPKHKGTALHPRIIDNDSSVRDASIRKNHPPKSGLGDGGRVTIRALKRK
jgi:hypothetical protein